MKKYIFHKFNSSKAVKTLNSTKLSDDGFLYKEKEAAKAGTFHKNYKNWRTQKKSLFGFRDMLSYQTNPELFSSLNFHPEFVREYTASLGRDFYDFRNKKYKQ